MGLLALTGCKVAPREIETVLELGAERVDIDVQLRDIRTGSNDDLSQLQLFEALHTWSPRFTEDLSWAPTPDRYRFSADAGRLSLSMHGTMSRADFERCARGFSLDGGDGACPRFPLHRTATGYALPPGFIEQARLVSTPGSKTSWAPDAGVISLVVGLTENTEKVTAGPSLVRGFELFSGAPERASATVALINETEKRLNASPGEAWHRAIGELRACREAPWCGLRLEAIRRSQARLVFRYLAELPEANVALPQPPEDARLALPESPRALVPGDKLTPLDALRLRVRYDVGLDAYRDHGSLSWQAADFAAICRPDVVKRRSLKDFCLRLGVP